jgi:hypothetical protein
VEDSDDDRLKAIAEMRLAVHDRYIAMKFDLETVLEIHGQLFVQLSINTFSKPGDTQEEPQGLSGRSIAATQDSANLDIITILKLLEPSFIAPAWQYNLYLDGFARELVWDEIKYSLPPEGRPSNIMRRLAYQVPAQSLLVAIKSGLDRLVILLSYYYRGFSPKTTFGRIVLDGKSRGLMAYALKNAGEDPLCKLLVDNYHEWIKAVVEPRDLIIHYNDMAVRHVFDVSLGLEIPILYGERLLLDKSSEDETTENKGWGPYALQHACNKWHSLFAEVVKLLLDREPVFVDSRIR